MQARRAAAASALSEGGRLGRRSAVATLHPREPRLGDRGEGRGCSSGPPPAAGPKQLAARRGSGRAGDVVEVTRFNTN